VCVATLVGAVAEGFVIDTDHWRHFFLLLGMIWGLSIATLNLVRAERQHAPVRARPMHVGPRSKERWPDRPPVRKRWRGPRPR
jgi:hypothetical protein